MTTAPLQSAGRMTWVDYARAAGIILVVLGHGNQAINRTAGLIWNDGLKLLDQFIYAFHMPIFFVLAGFMFSKARGQAIAKFTNGVWWGIVLPYVLWSVIWVALKILIPGAANVSAGWGAIPAMLWSPIEHFWFLYHLFFIRLFWYAANAVLPRGVQMALIVLACAASIVIDLRGPAFGVYSFFLFNLTLYGIGALILPAILDQWATRAMQWRTAGWSAVLFVSSVLTMSQLPDLGTSWDFSWSSPRLIREVLAFTAAIAGVLMTISLAHLLPQPDGFALRAFAYVGEASLAIYLTHTIVMATLRGVLLKSGVTSTAAILSATTLAGLIIPGVAYYVILRMGALAHMPLAKYAALGQSTRSNYFN
jgi:fucose 4-O-acetylase-like acetyltransferase